MRDRGINALQKPVRHPLDSGVPIRIPSIDHTAAAQIPTVIRSQFDSGCQHKGGEASLTSMIQFKKVNKKKKKKKIKMGGARLQHARLNSLRQAKQARHSGQGLRAAAAFAGLGGRKFAAGRLLERLGHVPRRPFFRRWRIGARGQALRNRPVGSCHRWLL
jgi:hypothetical protein